MDKKYTVAYYMKEQPKQYKTFNTHCEAVAFCKALYSNSECECYNIIKKVK